VAREQNAKRRDFYELLWHTGASQTDTACLLAEDVDWNSHTITRPFSLALTCCTDLLSENLAIGIFQINAPVFGGTHRTPDFQFDEMLTAVVHQGDRFHDKFISVEKELIRGG
jgi:hypothetical protein